MKITLIQLKNLNACSNQIDLFESRFGESIILTRQIVKKNITDFDISWFVNRFLTETQWKTYQDSVAPLLKTYQDGVATLRKTYQDSVAPLLKTYQDAAEHLWKVYNGGVASLLKTYQDAAEHLWKTYQDGKALLLSDILCLE